MKKTALLMALLLCISSLASGNGAAAAALNDWNQARDAGTSFSGSSLEGLWKKNDPGVRIRRLSETLQQKKSGDELTVTCGLWSFFCPPLPCCETLLVEESTPTVFYDNGKDRVLHRRE